MLRVEIQLVHASIEVTRRFQRAFDERLVYDHAGRDVGELRSPPPLDSSTIGLKFRIMSSAPIESAFWIEKFFVCFARTGE